MLIADGKVLRVAVFNGARRLLALFLMFVPVAFVAADAAFSVALALSALLPYFVMVRWVPIGRGSAGHKAGQLMVEAPPYTFSSISGQMRDLDVPIVTAFRGGVIAAAYGLGSR